MFDLEHISGAVRAPIPDFIAPQLASLGTVPPVGDAWVHELKIDGDRVGARIDNGKVTLFSRKQQDYTPLLPKISRELSRLPVTSAWLDGEIAMLDSYGVPSFPLLRARLHKRDPRMLYFVFDLLYLEGHSLIDVPLERRKELLKSLLERPESPRKAVQFLDHLNANPKTLLQTSCMSRYEGLISKLKSESYRPGERIHGWTKSKCNRRQEFVIGGFTLSTIGSPFGGLLVGYYLPDGRFRYASRVGTGFTDRIKKEIYPLLEERLIPESPFINPPTGGEFVGARWVRPELVAEVQYIEITPDGYLRHSSFYGLQWDKDPLSVMLEQPQELRQRRKPVNVKLRYPEQILYPDDGITLQEVVAYYEAVSARMLPHIKDRPLTLIYCPHGIGATEAFRPTGPSSPTPWVDSEGFRPCEYRKHAAGLPEGLVRVTTPGHADYVAVETAEQLLILASHGYLELHPWQSRYQRIEFPDRLVFDVDPAEDVPWEMVAEAALRVKLELKSAGLESWLQTSGVKGYHVVVPLQPTSRWEVATPFARRIAEAMESQFPLKYSASLRKGKRAGQILIDWARNGRGANSIAPYSLRARPGAPVATPITWEELVQGMKPDDIDLDGVYERLRQPDPWQGYAEAEQGLPGFL